MEAELERFRSKKRSDKRSKEVKEKLNNVWDSVTGLISRSVLPDPPTTSRSPPHQDQDQDDPDPDPDEGETEEEEEEDDADFSESEVSNEVVMWYTVKVLQISVWLLLYLGFIKIGFGAVYFTLSAMIFIWMNLGNKKGRKGKNEKSAYSVFNQNCEAINGSLKAEDLEKQLLFRQ